MTPMPVAPRCPRLFVGVAGRAARVLTTAACALALSVGAVAVAPSSARADDTITTQDYVSYYKLDQARAKGYTGKGVTIAMIDGTVDTSAPELAGADITVKTPCPYKEDNASKTAVSMGGSNEFVECFCWGAVVEGGSGAVVELVGDGVEVWLVAGDGGSFG